MSADADRRTPLSTARQWCAADWWYLGFLVMLVFQPVFDPGSGPVNWAVTIASVVVFIPLYLHVESHAGWLRRHSPAVATLIGLLVLPFNGGGTVFLIYAAAFAAAHTPRPTAFRWFVALSGIVVVVALYAQLSFQFALFTYAMPAMFVWIVGVSVLHDKDKERASEQLRIDNTRIEHLATAAERERIARDLHDLLGQSLTEVIVRAQLARRLLDEDRDRALEELDEIEGSSRRALGEVRATVRGWREVRVDEELEVVRRALQAAGIELHLIRDREFDPPPTTESALALALREAVTNVIRHADASRCTIALRREDGDDVVQVADDGHVGSVTEGSGLAGLRERIMALGGQVERSTDAGMSLTVRVPGVRPDGGASTGPRARRGLPA